jgi:hypothetical protein
MITTIRATVPCASPPTWAVLERALLTVLDASVYPFLEKYTREDGSLIWREDGMRAWQSRDGADDFYESSFNWPLLYVLGGGDHLLPLALRQWDAITAQLTRLGLVYKEYERGYDQFHQGESYIYFYFLCLADPTNPILIERARRFAGLYLNEDPEAPNYDAEHRLIRAPHNGSGGPRWGYIDGDPVYPWAAGMAVYGLPYLDVPDIHQYDDLHDAGLARRMGEVMQERMGRGDVVGNLGVTSLITNAYLITGDEKYRRWVVEYVEGWRERARLNGGLLPDNVGLSGEVGEYLDGKWYGGLYGWTWPHGFYNIEAAAFVAGSCALLLTGEAGYLDLPRSQLQHVLALGQTLDVRTQRMSLGHHWFGQLPLEGESQDLFVVPYRFGDQGWFDYQPLTPIYPLALWNLSRDEDDWRRIEEVRRLSGYDWRQVRSFRNKEESGHEQPWIMFLDGENPNYPEAILQESYGQVCRRLALIRADDADLTTVNIHHWQELNPVVTEALVQLTLGGPQIVYNGGLLQTAVRYFDLERRRPGLPLDVAALVTRLDESGVSLHLVNLSPFATRDLIVQAGAFGEHQFARATYDVRTSDFPGERTQYAAPELRVESHSITIDSKYLQVQLPPATEITISLDVTRFVNQPSTNLPW